MKKPRIDTSQGSLFLIKVGNDPQIQIQIIKRRVGNEKDFVEKIEEDTLGSVDNSLTMNLQKGFILSHAEVLPPRQDDSSRFDQGFNQGFG